jgi:hypothetical protein
MPLTNQFDGGHDCAGESHQPHSAYLPHCQSSFGLPRAHDRIIVHIRRDIPPPQLLLRCRSRRHEDVDLEFEVERFDHRLGDSNVRGVALTSGNERCELARAGGTEGGEQSETVWGGAWEGWREQARTVGQSLVVREAHHGQPLVVEEVFLDRFGRFRYVSFRCDSLGDDGGGALLVSLYRSHESLPPHDRMSRSRGHVEQQSIGSSECAHLRDGEMRHDEVEERSGRAREGVERIGGEWNGDESRTTAGEWTTNGDTSGGGCGTNCRGCARSGSACA